MRRVRLLALAFGLCLSLPAWAGQSHVVADGQTLGGIAKRYGVSIAELCKANGISRRDKIRPGQKLTIPTADSSKNNDSTDSDSAPAEPESKPDADDKSESAKAEDSPKTEGSPK